jgi:hypothetical protein
VVRGHLEHLGFRWRFTYRDGPTEVWARDDGKTVTFDAGVDLHDANGFATALKFDGITWDWA